VHRTAHMRAAVGRAPVTSLATAKVVRSSSESNKPGELQSSHYNEDRHRALLASVRQDDTRTSRDGVLTDRVRRSHCKALLDSGWSIEQLFNHESDAHGARACARMSLHSAPWSTLKTRATVWYKQGRAQAAALAPGVYGASRRSRFQRHHTGLQARPLTAPARAPDQVARKGGRTQRAPDPLPIRSAARLPAGCRQHAVDGLLGSGGDLVQPGLGDIGPPALHGGGRMRGLQRGLGGGGGRARRLPRDLGGLAGAPVRRLRRVLRGFGGARPRRARAPACHAAGACVAAWPAAAPKQQRALVGGAGQAGAPPSETSAACKHPPACLHAHDNRLVANLGRLCARSRRAGPPSRQRGAAGTGPARAAPAPAPPSAPAPAPPRRPAPLARLRGRAVPCSTSPGPGPRLSRTWQARRTGATATHALVACARKAAAPPRPRTPGCVAGGRHLRGRLQAGSSRPCRTRPAALRRARPWQACRRRPAGTWPVHLGACARTRSVPAGTTRGPRGPGSRMGGPHGHFWQTVDARCALLWRGPDRPAAASRAMLACELGAPSWAVSRPPLPPSGTARRAAGRRARALSTAPAPAPEAASQVARSGAQ